MATDHHKLGTCLCKLKKQQQLKVKKGYYPYQLSQHQRTPIGEIQLKGNWLIQAGFAIDSPVTVRVMDGCLVLTTEQSNYDV